MKSTNKRFITSVFDSSFEEITLYKNFEDIPTFISYLEITDYKNGDLNKLLIFKNLSHLKINNYNSDYLNLSNFPNLKKIEITFENNCKINFSNSLIESICFKSNKDIMLNGDIHIKLENLENLHLLKEILFCELKIYGNSLNFPLNIQKIKFDNCECSIEEFNFLNCINLTYLHIEYTGMKIKIINLEKCINLNYFSIFTNSLEKVILPSLDKSKEGPSSNLETLQILSDHGDIDEFEHSFNLINLDKQKELKKLDIQYPTVIKFNFPKLESLYLRFCTMKILDLNNNKNLNITLDLCNLLYIDFPYNYNDQYFISNNCSYMNKKIIRRRRIYRLYESVNKNQKCYRCKKNISNYNKINIRELSSNDYDDIISYITCC